MAADPLSPSARSQLMGRVRRRDTTPELRLRKALWAAGGRYRLKSRVRLPGSPDILFPGAKVVVFVDGCFWHGCPVHGTMPKTRTEFWAAKISRNRERDAEVDAALSGSGWTVLRFWEHDIVAQLDQCVGAIMAAVGHGHCATR